MYHLLTKILILFFFSFFIQIENYEWAPTYLFFLNYILCCILSCLTVCVNVPLLCFVFACIYVQKRAYSYTQSWYGYSTDVPYMEGHTKTTSTKTLHSLNSLYAQTAYIRLNIIGYYFSITWKYWGFTIATINNNGNKIETVLADNHRQLLPECLPLPTSFSFISLFVLTVSCIESTLPHKKQVSTNCGWVDILGDKQITKMCINQNK